jgi:uncharacterized membrane protein
MNTAPDRWTSLSAFFSDTVVQAVLGVLGLLVLCSIALYLLARLRDSNTKDQSLGDLLRKNFEEMRIEGEINDQEYRNIKALLREGEQDLSRAAGEHAVNTPLNPSKNDGDSKR